MAREQLSESAKAIVDTAALEAAAVGVVGGFVPLADLAGIGAIWAKMVYDLAKESGREIDSEMAKKIALSVTGGATLYIGGSRIFGWIISVALPGVGTLSVAGINAILDYIYTNRFGAILYNEFRSPKFTTGLLAVNIAGMIATVFALPGIGDVGDAFHAVSGLIHGGAAEATAHAATLAADHATHLATAADALHGAHHAVASAAPHFGGLTHAAAAMHADYAGLFHAPLYTQAQTLQDLADALQAAPGHAELAGVAQDLVQHYHLTQAIDPNHLQTLIEQVHEAAPTIAKRIIGVRFGGNVS